MNKLFYRNIYIFWKQFFLVWIFLFGLVLVLVMKSSSLAQSFGGRPTQTRIQPGSGAFSQFGNHNWAQRVQQYHNYYGPRPLSQPVYPGFHPSNPNKNKKHKKNLISPKEEKKENTNSLQADESSSTEKEEKLKTFDKNETIH